MKLKLGNKTTGWIGVDVGTSTVKVAQVVRDQGRWKLASSAIIPRSTIWCADDLEAGQTLSSTGELAAAATLLGELRGRAAAATLSMAVCETHHCDGTVSLKGDRNVALQKLVATATCQPASHLQCAAWPAERGKDGAPLKTNIIAAPQALSEQLCRDMQHNGWSCQTIDGLPFTLARAVSMTSPDCRDRTWAAVDLGYSQSTCCIVQRGMPVYVRPLKSCSLRGILGTLEEELNVNHTESMQLLQQHNLSAPVNDPADHVVRQALVKALSKLSFELERTLCHLQSQRRTILPVGAFLFGGGACLQGLADWLTTQIELECRNWSLSGVGESEQEPASRCPHLLGPAIALSALAWEKR